MQGYATPHTPDHNKLTQMTGGLGPMNTDYVYAANLTIYSSHGFAVQVITTAAVGNATLNAGTIGRRGEIWVIEIANDAGGARTITWGTGFRATGNVVGQASKSIFVTFVSNGTAWLEQSRSASAV